MLYFVIVYPIVAVEVIMTSTFLGEGGGGAGAESECCVPSAVDFKAAGGSVVHFASRALNCCKHDMGTLHSLLGKCRNTQNNAHPPFWWSCKVYSVLGCSLARLRYKCIENTVKVLQYELPQIKQYR